MKLIKPNTKWGIARGFGNGHNGIDYKYPSGTPVTAAADGVVDFEGNGANDPWTLAMGGIYVRLKHSDGSFTGYAHLSNTVVNKGQKVKAGQLIAHSGATGNVTGPHLHFEVIPKVQNWENGYSARINPEPFFAVPAKAKPSVKKAQTTNSTNVRMSPSLSGRIARIAPKGEVFTYDKIVTGTSVSGKNKWYHSTANHFVWEGNVKKI